VRLCGRGIYSGLNGLHLYYADVPLVLSKLRHGPCYPSTMEPDGLDRDASGLVAVGMTYLLSSEVSLWFFYWS
jgi:hypothetical protein